MNKQKLLDKIVIEIENCKTCKKDKSGKAVPGEGNPDADVIFIGEAPGKNEAKTGRPFIGRSGQYLRKNIREILNLKEEDVFITSPVKYLPDRGTPTPADIAHGRIHLMKQFDIIKPKIVVLMGAVAIQGVLKEKVAVMQKHGTTLKRGGVTYFLTIHPAAAIRFAKHRITFESDFNKLTKLLSKV